MTLKHLLKNNSDEFSGPCFDSQETADEEAVMESFLSGKTLDPEIAQRVHARAQAIRDRVFREHGLVDIAVPAIRELRDE